ncbi:probable serine/threonine-protein kinase At1g54610 isoform X2 [Gastrolobium bilobum]|uniref:probable serine/threonine-protein kinase At1g54610 isoform X2 n=1 Tax=Gastrolobium bilobum TaxID=150636 RepID=UPI002AB01221|nr:probable serine/threonine-protein kinase At1g54610 isoform X2 [Gastrolobium bilobum]
MGCITSKSSAVEDSREGLTKELTSSSKRTSEMNVSRLNSKKRVDGVWGKDKFLDGVDMKVSLIDKKGNGSVRLYDDQNGKKKMEKPELSVLDYPGLGRVPKASEGEQVAAGWPTWLSSVAGEAIQGWIPRSANTFERFYKIGQGTYSTVYKARDVAHQKIVALKRVRFDNLDPESVKFMAREILVLRRLDHPNVIKLEGLITSQTSRSLYLVLEYMEHDLTGLASGPGIKFSEPQVKCYMQQLLSGLDHCHSRGVLHRDIKGSNLLIDNNGILKIADFGLANFFDPHHGVPLTSRVVTLWYRPPELLLGASDYGAAVDLWSAGCILGELYCGRPILPGKTEVEQLHKIFKLCGSPSEDYWRKLRLQHSTIFRPPHQYRRCVAETFKEYPSTAMRLIETLLSVDPALRGTTATALKSEFFSSEPLACDPSSLPKYPPSKEIDTKLREEATRRQGPVGGKEQKVGPGVRQEKEPGAFVLSKDNADSRTSIQQGQRLSNSKSRIKFFNPHREPASGFFDFRHKQSEDIKEMENYFSGPLIKGPSHSGPLVPGSGWEKVGKEAGQWLPVSNKVNLSKLSGLMASRTLPFGDQEENQVPLRPRETIQVQKSLESTNGTESRRRHDEKRQSQRIDLSQIENGKVSAETLIQDGHGSKENKIYLSGPLLVSANNMDQMLKEHDRKIQEYSRRARIDKSKGEKVCVHQN